METRLSFFAAVLTIVSTAQLPPSTIQPATTATPFFLKDIRVVDSNDTLAGQIRITGGEEAEKNSFPYQVGLRITSYDGRNTLCGGSLISESYILTAAHCVENADKIVILIGAHSITKDEKSRIEQTVYGDSVIIHEKWNSKKIQNDIALIVLETPVSFNQKVSAIDLPRKSQTTDNFAEEKAIASGWGIYKDNKSITSSVLRYADLTIIERSECKWFFGSMIRSTNICTCGHDGSSTCNGDSGGPLVINDKHGVKTLIGITSFGSAHGCELGAPAVFTKVSAYLDWIADNSDVELRE